MILKGNQRGGAAKLAQHLLRTDENEHVTVHELRGFASDDLTTALREVEAISKGTRCRQYLFSLSLNPPQEATASVADFEDAADEIEEKLGLKGQPRAIVFHEKEGRRHAHVVWSRIDSEQMRAINLPHYKLKLREMSRRLYLEHEWQMPDGLRDRTLRNTLRFTRAEWQQAKRAELDARELKAMFKGCWEASDTRETLQNALRENGFWLARGDRRGFVAVDYRGEVYALSKWSGIRAKQVNSRLGDPNDLETVDQVKMRIGERMSSALSRFVKDVEADARKRSATLSFRRGEMAGRHCEERRSLEQIHETRWISETNARAARLPRGFKGIWHRITGRYAEIRSQNEREAWDAHKRDQAEMDELILRQLEDRRALQIEIVAQRKRRHEALLELRADIARYQELALTEHSPVRKQNQRKSQRGRSREDRNRGPRNEP